jgi:hypothetical protein
MQNIVTANLFDESFRAPNKSTLQNIQAEHALDHQE